MKKYISILFVFTLFVTLLGFNINSASASDSGCTSAGPYSTTTGQLCSTNTTVVTCPTGDLFSSATGQACTAWQANSPSITANPQLKIGSKGDDVIALQQTLTKAGFSVGKIDGVYGPITAMAAASYYKKYPVICPLTEVNGIATYPCSPLPTPIPVPCPVAVTNGAMMPQPGCPPIPVQTSSITVLSPNGGETWTKGTTQTINWQDKNACSAGAVCSGGLSEIKYDLTLVQYYPPCTSNICPMYPISAPRTIATNVSGSSYAWQIPNCMAANPCSSNFEIGAGSYMVQVCQSGTDICDSSDSYFKIISGTVSNSSPVISGVSGPQTLNVNQQGTWTVTASSTNGENLSYSVNWGDDALNPTFGQPNFINSAGQTGTFTHTYYQARTFTPIFTVTDSNGQSAQTSLSVSVGGGETTSSLSIVTDPTLPNGQVSASYYATLSASGGTGSYTWSIKPNNLMCVQGLSCGTLPPGLSLSQLYPPCAYGSACPSQGVISGTPTTAGAYTFGLTVTDGSGASASKTFSINISGGTTQTPAISSLSPTSGAVGTSVTIFGSGFTSTGNTVISSGLQLSSNLSSSNGTALQFTFPSAAGAYCGPVTGTNQACPMYMLQISPGNYPITVINSFGKSNSLNFTVTSSSSLMTN